jgi:hypothetical protein
MEDGKTMNRGQNIYAAKEEEWNQILKCQRTTIWRDVILE